MQCNGRTGKGAEEDERGRFLREQRQRFVNISVFSNLNYGKLVHISELLILFK